jgi:hypothetical protein
MRPSHRVYVMVPDSPTLAPPAPAVRTGGPFRRIAGVQGAYFLLTGLWSLFDIDSFQAVTGAKTDLWLVYLVGALVSAIGLGLLVAAVSGRVTLEVAVIAVGSALAFAGIDIVFVTRGVISWVYLLDAAAELGLISWWAMTHFGVPRWRAPRTPQYPHVQALLNRGQSVSPNGRH